jgi:hypothetical protein
MFIRTISPDSGEILYHDVTVFLIEASKLDICHDGVEITRLLLDGITVDKTLTIKEFAEQVKRIIMTDGKLPDDMEHALRGQFWVSKEAIPELLDTHVPLQGGTQGT